MIWRSLGSIALRWTEFAFLGLFTLGVVSIDLCVLTVTYLLISNRNGPPYAILVCIALAVLCAIATSWWFDWALFAPERRHRLLRSFEDCCEIDRSSWRATSGWRICLLLAGSISLGIYYPDPIWVLAGVAGGLVVIEFCFPNLTQSTANAVRLIRARTSRVTEIVQLVLGFATLVGLLATGSIAITAQKLNVAYTHLEFCLAEMLVGIPVAIFLLLVLVALSPAACLVRNCLLAFAEDQRREAVRRVGVAAVTLAGAIYLCCAFCVLMTTPESYGRLAACELNALDELAVMPVGKKLRDRGCHSQ